MGSGNAAISSTTVVSSLSQGRSRFLRLLRTLANRDHAHRVDLSVAALDGPGEEARQEVQIVTDRAVA
jgi:hypothetical protein